MTSHTRNMAIVLHNTSLTDFYQICVVGIQIALFVSSCVLPLLMCLKSNLDPRSIFLKSICYGNSDTQANWSRIILHQPYNQSVLVIVHAFAHFSPIKLNSINSSSLCLTNVLSPAQQSNHSLICSLTWGHPPHKLNIN